MSALVVLFGCSDGANGGFPFGTAMGPQPTSAALVTSGGSTAQDGGSTVDDSPMSGATQAVDGPADPDPDTTGSPTTATAAGATESSGSMRDATGPTGATTDGTTGTTGTTGDEGVGNPGVQPAAGMYSECSMFDACPPLVDPFCLSAGPAFGFCTVQCNASNECDPSPGDTTTSICDPTLGYCMLDCANGSCPTGLDCVVGDLGGGVVSRCLEQ